MDNLEEYYGLYNNEMDTDIGTNFAGAFKLPFAGGRDCYDASLYDQGSYGYYWSSSPSYIYTNILRFDSSVVRSDYETFRVLGTSVRCFKNTYEAPSFTIELDANGGEVVETTLETDSE